MVDTPIDPLSIEYGVLSFGSETELPDSVEINAFEQFTTAQSVETLNQQRKSVAAKNQRKRGRTLKRLQTDDPREINKMAMSAAADNQEISESLDSESKRQLIRWRTESDVDLKKNEIDENHTNHLSQAGYPFRKYKIFNVSAQVNKNRSMFGQSSICVIECEGSLMRFQTLCECNIVDKSGDILKTVPFGEEVELRAFEREGEDSMRRDGFWAPVVDHNCTGSVSLFRDADTQYLEISQKTYECSYMHLYTNKNKMKKKKPYQTFPLSNLLITEKSTKNKIYFRQGNDEYTLKLKTREDYLAMHFLLSRNRELSESERMKRMMGRGYTNTNLINEAFMERVVVRMVPQQREQMMKLDIMGKIQQIEIFDHIMELKTLDVFLEQLDGDVNARDLAFMRGSLINENPEWVLGFIEQGGISKLVAAVDRLHPEKQRKRNDGVYQVYIVTLECLEAIMDKPAEEGNQPGLYHIMNNTDAMTFILKQLSHPNHKVRHTVVKLLIVMTAWCSMNRKRDMFENLIDVQEEFAQSEGYHHPWEPFVIEFKNQHKVVDESEIFNSDAVEFMLSIMVLINSMLMFQDTAQARTMLRQAMEGFGFLNVLEEINISLREYQDDEDVDIRRIVADWGDEVDTFNYSRKEDQRLLKFDGVDFSQPNEVFDYLLHQCVEDGNVEELSQILRSLLFIPREFHNIWSMCEELLARATNNVTARLYNHEQQQEGQTMDQLITHLNNRLKENDPQNLFSVFKDEISNLNSEIDSKNMVIQVHRENVEAFKEQLQIHQFDISKLSKELKAKDEELEKQKEAFNKEIEQLKQEVVKASQGVRVEPGVAPGPVVVLAEDLKPFEKSMKFLPPNAIMNNMKKQGLKDVEQRYDELKKYVEAIKSGAVPGVPAAKAAPAPPKPTIAPDLEKYVKMTKFLPRNALINKMRQDGLKNGEQRYEELQRYLEELKNPKPAAPAKEAEPAKVALPPKPEIAKDLVKYAKMAKFMPKNAIQNKMRMDGISESDKRVEEIFEWKEKVKQWEEECKNPKKKEAAKPAEAPKPVIADDLKKYLKMRKFLPPNALINKMRQDGIKDPDVRMKEIEDYEWQLANPGQKKEPEVSKPVIADDLKKYLKMRKFMPPHALINKMRQDGINNPDARMKEIEDYEWQLANPGKKKEDEVKKPVLAEDLKKYLKMKKFLPPNALINKMKQDGIKNAGERMKEIEDYEWQLANPGKTREKKPELAEDLQKYLKQLKRRLPRHAVINNMKRDGVKNAEKRFTEIENFLNPKANDGIKNAESRMEEIEGHLNPKRTPSDRKEKPKSQKMPLKRIPKTVYSDSQWWKETVGNSSDSMSEFSEIFSEMNIVEEFTKPKRKPAEAKPEVKKKKKVAEINLVGDPKKKQRMDFLAGTLRRMNITYRDVRNAIWAMDGGKKLDNEMLESVTGVLPDTEDDLAPIKMYQGDISKLNKPSQLWLNIANIPKSKLRMKNWTFTLGFQESLDKVDELLKILETSVWGIRDNKSLHKMFLLILDVLKATERGKYFNGFPLRNLYTVSKKICKDGKTTWLQKLCRMCTQKQPSTLDFVKELQCLKEAEKNRDFDAIKKMTKSVQQGRQKIINFLRSYEKQPPKVDEGAFDGCVKYFKNFIVQTDGKVDVLLKRLDTLSKDCMKLAKDLGEKEKNENKAPNTAYIMTIYEFVDKTQKAIDKNIAMDKAQERLERIRKKEAEKKKRRQKKRKATQASVSMSRTEPLPHLVAEPPERMSLSRSPHEDSPLTPPKPPSLPITKPESTIPEPLPPLQEKRNRTPSRDGSHMSGSYISLSPEVLESHIPEEQRIRRKGSMMRTGFMKQQLESLKSQSRARAKRIRRMSNISFRHGSSGMKSTSLLGKLEDISSETFRKSDSSIAADLMRIASGPKPKNSMVKRQVVKKKPRSMFLSPKKTHGSPPSLQDSPSLPSANTTIDFDQYDSDSEDDSKPLPVKTKSPPKHISTNQTSNVTITEHNAGYGNLESRAGETSITTIKHTRRERKAGVEDISISGGGVLPATPGASNEDFKKI